MFFRYRGVGAPMVSLTFLNMLNFSNYEYFKKIFGVSTNTIPSREINVRVIMAGVCVGPFAAFISTPFELVKTQMQLSKLNGIEYRSSIHASLSIYKTYGLRALYKGHTVNSLREVVFLV